MLVRAGKIIGSLIFLATVVERYDEYVRPLLAWLRSTKKETNALQLKCTNKVCANPLAPPSSYSSYMPLFLSPPSCHYKVGHVLKVLRPRLEQPEFVDRLGDTLSEQMDRCPGLKKVITEDKMEISADCGTDGIMMKSSSGAFLAIEGNVVTFIPAEQPTDPQSRFEYLAIKHLYDPLKFREIPAGARNLIASNSLFLQAIGKEIDGLSVARAAGPAAHAEQVRKPKVFHNNADVSDRPTTPTCKDWTEGSDRKQWRGSTIRVLDENGKTEEHCVKKAWGFFYSYKRNLFHDGISLVVETMEKIIPRQVFGRRLY